MYTDLSYMTYDFRHQINW